MKTKRFDLKADFGADTRFELLPALPFQPTQEDGFERLKAKLLAARLRKAGTKWETALNDAANEAAALAWTTTVPSLVFQALFEEKAAAAVLQTQRQSRILRKSRDLITA